MICSHIPPIAYEEAIDESWINGTRIPSIIVFPTHNTNTRVKANIIGTIIYSNNTSINRGWFCDISRCSSIAPFLKSGKYPIKIVNAKKPLNVPM